ncbi:diguanylate cyclase (GGDEF)-like protein/PAS domain S-box-containing protein [Tardiphaga robiniae]|uniref:bifunctional diguanylate cyclase/phosphodiesterase n=1 Tax=Tardiphaga robiniae TaxID=943830 RepID=UPI00285DDEF5|nr:PAS-domain containing protein [Tardiphaga robiniae]MDR6660614.1 diguanylate cyclase (GGDEF)-like protein/PAS domain S-box-containing protein [Tardiphaga robiniae]
MRAFYGRLARLPGFSLVVLGVFFATSIIVVFLVNLQARHHAALSEARKAALNIAEILAEHTALTFEGIDRTLLEAERIREDSLSGKYATPEAANTALRLLKKASSIVVAVGWTDAGGNLLAHSYDRTPPRSNISDMLHFTAQRDQADGRLFIAPPYPSAVTDKWLTAASRRLSNADGSFAGVVTAPLDPTHFTQVYRAIDVGKGGSVLLLHRAGTGRVLAREPARKGAIGKSFADSPLVSEYLPKSEAGTYETIGVIDGIARLAGYKAVPGLPLVLVITYARSEVLGPWRQHLYMVGPLVAMIVAVILFGTFRILRQTNSLAVKTRILERTNMQFDAALSNMSLGLCLFDANKNLVVSNGRFREMYGFPEELVRPGTPLSLMLQALKDRGKHDLSIEGDVQEIPTKQRQIFMTADGRVILIQRRSIADGGWVATHEDITEQKRAQRLLTDKAAELERINMRFDAAMNNMSQGLSLFDGEQRIILSNARYAEIYHLSEEQVKPGTTLRQIIEYRRAKRTNCEMAADVLVDAKLKLEKEVQELVDGRLISMTRHLMPTEGWLATHEDVTAQKHREQLLATKAVELEQTNERFDIALSNMSQGLCMFDGAKRLVVWNDRYAELYQLPAALLKVGTPHEAIIADRVSRGILKGGTSEPAIRKKIAELGQHSTDSSSARVDEFADGRLMLVTRQPMKDGGWVATHEDITERRRAEAEIVHLARHDALTGLANRTLFTEKLEEASQRLSRHDDGFAVVMLDLDRFKTVNDTLGHPAGDRLLVEFAQRLKSSTRETDVLARLGGDEFAIIQDGGPNPQEGAIVLALRIIDAIAQPFDLNGHQASIGISIGIALAPEQGVDPEDLLRKADLALYDAKTGGRNDFRLFQSEMIEAAHSQKILANELRDAIARNEFEVHYQPVVDAKTRQIRGAEALVRWRHPSKGLVAPDQFIPLAEATGLILPLGEWILHQACTDAASWPAHLKIMVNISAVQVSKGKLLDVMLDTLMETGLSPERLELEITETALLENATAHLGTIRQLKNLGISIALDDFGTGYSTASYLTNFPFDRIKIDKSFAQGAPNRRDCAAVVSSVLALARGLGIATTAEGVETEEQFEYLQAAGVDLVQGFLFGRPVPLSEFDLDAAVSFGNGAADGELCGEIITAGR